MRRWATWLASGLVLALLVTLAVVADGFDSRETPREDPSVWVARSGGQYARVNTETAEIDTVRVAESPSGLVQTTGASLLLTQGFGRAWRIDPTAPQDVREEEAASEEAVETPTGTRQVLAAGGAILYVTEAGEAFLASAGDPGEYTRLDAGADAAALDESGRVALYSEEAGGVRWFDAATGEPRGGASETPASLSAEGVQLAIVGGEWVLLDASAGMLWREGGAEPVPLELTGTALLQGSGAAAAEVLVADEGGLWSVGRGGAERAAEAAGVPARPEAVGGEMVAAWVGGSGATLWTGRGGAQPLELDPAVERIDDPEPVIRTNGDRAVVAEVGTGMLWRVPDGRLIPVAQWVQVDPPKQETGTVVTQDVTEQEPPVAVDDRFGVRAGEPAPLPVLLNDYDPNRKDVLTVVPEGLGDGLPEGFGSVELLADGQGLSVRPGAAAEGTARFSYRITDGVHVSDPATVTLTVVEGEANSAPGWCAVEGCRRDWPSPELTPGGTLVVPVLEGWVDPEGDPMTLSAVRVLGAGVPVRALVTDDGRLAVRHTDPSAEDGDIGLRVTVTDALGESQERELRVRVRASAVAELAPMASTIAIGETATLRPLTRVAGGSGSFALVDAVVQASAGAGGDANPVRVRVNQGAGTIELSAESEGSALVAVTVRDSVTERDVSGVIRVTAVEDRPPLALPPLRAFVRPLADSTVEVLDAIPNSSGRALSVRSATVVPDSLGGGSLRADVIEHARIRVSGGTADGQPGRIGSVDVVVAEGERTTTGRLTVFQVPETSGGAIAVADSATVRAGSVVDIRVLDNDISRPGERLVLSPEVQPSGAAGELVFASGGRLRYLAPKKPGVYTLGYTSYGASSPDLSDTAQVLVTVLPAGANRDPQPGAVTVRVGPGERVAATIPVSGVDPDGDRARLVGIGAPEDPQLTASILPRTSSVQVAASRSALPGTHYVPYTVRDDFGGEAEGRLRIVVTDPDPGGGAPVVYSDYVRIAGNAPAPAVVRPLDNDLDPAGGELELVEVVPNVPGGEASAEYRRLVERLDLSELDEGVVRIAGGDELGTASFRYTVRSSASTSTADGLIVVQISNHVGQQAPTITDTVLSVRDRAHLGRDGVDVVTGRVRWATGDVADLKLSLWGAAADRYTVRNNRIFGSYRAEGDLVTFRLSGLDASDAEAEGFGFLVIPPLDELRLTLKPGLPPISVAEGESEVVEVRELLDLGPGDQVELASGGFATQREQSRCVAVGTAAVRYTAGRGGPWSDACTVRVRLVEQRAYTLLPLPVSIVPDEPAAVLNPLTRTIAPGASATVELADMVAWQGGRAGDVADLRWRVSGSTAAFQTQLSGSALRVQARADAAPGAQEALTVSVSGAGRSESTLTLRVGEAARDTPRGGTVALRCRVGETCSAPLVGVAGEHDPFGGSLGGGLHLVSVDAGGCAVGTMRAVGDAVRVDWPDPRGPGGTCTASFTVRDAQNRTGTGTIELDAGGVPRAPAGLATVGYTATSVTLRVTPGEAQNAHPALQRMVLRQADTGTTTPCSADGSSYLCEVGGLVVGEPHGFAAVAINEVGESDPSGSVTAWAYRPPPPPAVSATQLDEGTTETRGMVRFVIGGSGDVKEHRIVLNGSVFATLSGSSVDATIQVPVGAHSLAVVPVSRFSSPLDPADNAGASTPPQPLTVAGLPVMREPAHSYDHEAEQLTVTVIADANLGGALSYGAALGESCEVGDGGDTIVLPLSAAPGETVRITVCARNDRGTSTRTTDIIIDAPPAGGTP